MKQLCTIQQTYDAMHFQLDIYPLQFRFKMKEKKSKFNHRIKYWKHAKHACQTNRVCNPIARRVR